MSHQGIRPPWPSLWKYFCSAPSTLKEVAEKQPATSEEEQTGLARRMLPSTEPGRHSCATQQGGAERGRGRRREERQEAAEDELPTWQHGPEPAPCQCLTVGFPASWPHPSSPPVHGPPVTPCAKGWRIISVAMETSGLIQWHHWDLSELHRTTVVHRL